MSINMRIENITPEEAASMLKRNHVNRNPREGLVLAYRKDMEAGRWVMTGEPIQFGKDGSLLNGQHRLTALAGSSVVDGINFVVVRDLEESAQLLMDKGAPRSIADMIKLEHGAVKNVAVVSSISRWLSVAPLPGPDFGPRLKGKVSAAMALETFRQKGEQIMRAAEKGVHLCNTTLAISPTALGYTWFQFEKVDVEDCQRFFYAFQELAFNLQGDPRKAAYTRIIKMMAEPDAKAGNWTSVAHVSVLTRAWNAWRGGEQVDSIMVRNKTGLISPVTPK